MQQSDDSSAPSAPSAPAESSAPTALSNRLRKAVLPPGPRRKSRAEREVLRMQSPGYPNYTWRGLDPKQVRTIEGTTRVNEWELRIIEHAASIERKSFSKFLRESALEAALALIISREET